MKTCEDCDRLSGDGLVSLGEIWNSVGWWEVWGWAITPWRLSALQPMNSAFVPCLDIKSNFVQNYDILQCFSHNVSLIVLFIVLEKQEVSLAWKHPPPAKLCLKITCPRNIGFNSKAEQEALVNSSCCFYIHWRLLHKAKSTWNSRASMDLEGAECGCLGAS